MTGRARAGEPRDAGQVSVLIVGLVVVAAALLFVVTNVSRVFLLDRSLAAAADGAAVAAAGSLDPTRAGRAGPGAGDTVAPDPVAPDSLAPDSLAPDSLTPDSLTPEILALSPTRARDAVARYVADSGLAARFGPGFGYDVAVADGVVTVTLSARVGLMFLGPLAGDHGGGVPLSATAGARSVRVR